MHKTKIQDAISVFFFLQNSGCTLWVTTCCSFYWSNPALPGRHTSLRGIQGRQRQDGSEGVFILLIAVENLQKKLTVWGSSASCSRLAAGSQQRPGTGEKTAPKQRGAGPLPALCCKGARSVLQPRRRLTLLLQKGLLGDFISPEPFPQRK